MFCDAPESTMFSIEATLVAGAAAERRKEFGTVRFCARQALHKIGIAAAPILPDADGAPCWPPGVVGSMTHCAGYRAAVVAHSRALRSVGIDAEPDARLSAPVLELILRDEELAQLRVLADVLPIRHWDRIIFCAKEAVFKAWFPLTRSWLDFQDVLVTACPDGTFLAFIHAPLVTDVGPIFVGRWTAGRGLIVAATSVGESPSGTIERALPGSSEEGESSLEVLM